MLTDINIQRPVKMPDRWVRALGNCAMLHQNMEYKFHIEGMQAKSFIAMLPAATGKGELGMADTYKDRCNVKAERREKQCIYQRTA